MYIYIYREREKERYIIIISYIYIYDYNTKYYISYVIIMITPQPARGLRQRPPPFQSLRSALGRLLLPQPLSITSKS